MRVVIPIVIAVVVLAGCTIAVPRSRLVLDDLPSGSGRRLPTVSGYNLSRQEREFPRDFSKPFNLVFVAFKQVHQQDINTWLEFADGLESTRNDFTYYEFPTITNLSLLGRTFVNEGMRAGIPDPAARERTVTLYIDVDAFQQTLGIASDEVIQVFLMDQDGMVLWRDQGQYSERSAGEILAYIAREQT